MQGVLLGLDATVLSVCHRLQHVSRYDWVVVMGNGEVVEAGPPGRLLHGQGSKGSPGDGPSELAKLYAQAGLAAP